MNPGPLFRRENIKLYEFLWVILGAVVATAIYDASKPDHDIRWFALLLSSGWASVCSFNIYRKLDEKWQKALRDFRDALRVYDAELFTDDEVENLHSWFYGGALAALSGVAACFLL